MAEDPQDWVELFRSIPLSDEDQVVRRLELARDLDGNPLDPTTAEGRKAASELKISEHTDPPAREAKVVFYSPSTGKKREHRIPARTVQKVKGWLEAGVRQVPIHPDEQVPGEPDYVEVPFTQDDLGRLPVGALIGKGGSDA